MHREVGEIDPAAAGDHDVVGFDVTMADATLMALSQSLEQLIEDPEFLEVGEERTCADTFGERGPVPLSHDEHDSFGDLELLVRPDVRQLDARESLADRLHPVLRQHDSLVLCLACFITSPVED